MLLPVIILPIRCRTSLQVSETEQLSIKAVYDAYCETCAKEAKKPVCLAILGKCLKRVFPNLKRVTSRKGCSKKKFGHVYDGIAFRKTNTLAVETSLTLNTLQTWIPSGYIILACDSQFMEIQRRTGLLVNGNHVSLEIRLFKDGKWSMQVGGNNVCPDDVGLPKLIDMTEASVKSFFYTTQGLNICRGRSADTVSPEIDSNKLFTEHWGSCSNNETEVRIRHVECIRVAKLLSTSGCCIICQKRISGINYITKKKPFGNHFENVEAHAPTSISENEIELNDQDHTDLMDVLNKIIPNCPQEFKTLLQSQAQHFNSKNKKSNRWPQEIIQLCLTLWTRSPRSYQDLAKSGFLALPSGRLLHYYKSSVKQTPGFNSTLLKWMNKEAIRQQVSNRQGGLLLDEMAIQEDLQICKRGGTFSLMGFTDMGAEANSVEILTKGKKVSQLATHVMQLTFLGYNGFRFPVANFPSSTANAPQLYNIFWEAVHHLKLYEFDVQYCCMDGASANRSFIKMHFPSTGGAKANNYKVYNMYSNSEIVLMQDYSHVMKKIRNSLYKSSRAPNFMRRLCKGHHYILWEHWINAYNWDINTNPFPLHRKLTDEHIYLSTQSKMRNHLAEEVLNSDMLHLMKKFKNSLDEGDYLDSSIEFLEHTSLLVKCFRDVRPIQEICDDHLQKNQVVLAWFSNWESEVLSKTIKNKDKEKQMISAQCREDLDSLILGFHEICKMRLSKPSATIVPGWVNSDPIENFFCQQRAKHNGANTNPNYYSYLTGINSIILGESTISSKSNAGKVAAQPYQFQTPGTLKPRKMPRL